MTDSRPPVRAAHPQANALSRDPAGQAALVSLIRPSKRPRVKSYDPSASFAPRRFQYYSSGYNSPVPRLMIEDPPPTAVAREEDPR